MININERDRGNLERMLIHCRRIEDAKRRFGNTAETFSSDYDYQDVVNMNVFQLGEITNQLSDELKESIPEIPWHKIYGIRNIIAHAYVIVDSRTIWETIQTDIPDFAKIIRNYLSG